MAAALVVSSMSGCVRAFDGSHQTVGDLKRAIEERQRISRYQQQLVLGDRILTDDDALGGQPLCLVVLPHLEGTEAIVDAIWSNNIGALERALRLPANPNGPPVCRDEPKSLLREALEFGSADMVQLLLDAFADPNERYRVGSAETTTISHIAAENGDQFVRQLAAARADVNVVDASGMTPLMVSEECDKRDRAELAELRP